MSPLEAKRDERHISSGEFIAFQFDDENYDKDDSSSFYNYLYYLGIKDSVPEDDIKELSNYNYFTDIEFNPNKGKSNQARAITLIKAMYDQLGEIPEMTFDEFHEFQESVLEEI